jgi:hypothetical protein
MQNFGLKKINSFAFRRKSKIFKIRFLGKLLTLVMFDMIITQFSCVCYIHTYSASKLFNQKNASLIFCLSDGSEVAQSLNLIFLAINSQEMLHFLMVLGNISQATNTQIPS